MQSTKKVTSVSGVINRLCHTLLGSMATTSAANSPTAARPEMRLPTTLAMNTVATPNRMETARPNSTAAGVGAWTTPIATATGGKMSAVDWNTPNTLPPR